MNPGQPGPSGPPFPPQPQPGPSGYYPPPPPGHPQPLPPQPQQLPPQAQQLPPQPQPPPHQLPPQQLPGGIPPQAPMEAGGGVEMWTTGGWPARPMPDSGISTATPSVMSGASSIVQGLCASSGPPSHASYEGYGTPGANPLHQMFPERYAVDAGGSASDVDPSPVIPELISFLRDSDLAPASKVASIVYQLVNRSDYCTGQFLRHADFVSTVVQVANHWMAQPNNPQACRLVKDLCKAVHKFSCSNGGALALSRANPIPLMLHGIRFSSEVDSERSVLFYLVPTLHNLILQSGEQSLSPQDKQVVEALLEQARSSGLVETLARSLREPEPKYIAIAADCIKILIHKNSPAKARLLADGGVEILLEICRSQNYEKALRSVTKCLKSLSVDPACKLRIIQCDGIKALTAHLRHASQQFLYATLGVLSNLSDVAILHGQYFELIEATANFLGSIDHQSVSLCLGILSNLACTEAHKAYMVDRARSLVPEILLVLYQCVQLVIQLQSNPANGEPIYLFESIELALCTLKRLCFKHESEQKARLLFRDTRLPDGNSGTHLLVQFLTAGNAEIVREAMGCVRYLAKDPELVQALAVADIPRVLSEKLHRRYMDYHQLLTQQPQQPQPTQPSQPRSPKDELEKELEELLRTLAALGSGSATFRDELYNLNRDYIVHLTAVPENAPVTLRRQALLLLRSGIEALGLGDLVENKVLQTSLGFWSRATVDPNSAKPTVPQLAADLMGRLQQAATNNAFLGDHESDPFADSLAPAYPPNNSPMDMM